MSEAQASTAPTPSAKEGGMNGNNSNNNMSSMTPPRHNYANTNTPIASTKRPRSSLNRATQSGGRASASGTPGPGGANNNSMDAMLTSPAATAAAASQYSNGTSSLNATMTPGASSSSFDDVALTPLHPPKSRVHIPHNLHGTGAAIKSMTSSGSSSSATHDAVEGKVNALFSPVLNFLASHVPSGRSGDDSDAVLVEGDNGGGTQSTVDMMMDKDDMTQPTASETSSSKSISPSNQTLEEEEDEEEHVVDDDDDDEHMQPATESLNNSNEETLSCCDSLQPIEEDNCEDDEFNPWQFIKSLPDYDEVARLCPMEYTLAPKRADAPRLTLVLDLDETLVHCTVDPVPDADLQFPVQFHGTTYQVHVRLRPCLQQFLEKVYQQYEVVVFTASQKVYANELLNLIDPGTCCTIVIICHLLCVSLFDISNSLALLLIYASSFGQTVATFDIACFASRACPSRAIF
jgi:NLI interacting factor-like phosphatase